MKPLEEVCSEVRKLGRDMILNINDSTRKIEKFTREAYAAHAAGDSVKAKACLSQALDYEFDLTLDAEILGSLGDEWNVDGDGEEVVEVSESGRPMNQSELSFELGKGSPTGDFPGSCS